MNKEKFRHHFKINDKTADHENRHEIKIINLIKSATCEITNAELTLVAKEIQKPCNRKVKYQKVVPETTKKKEVGMNAKVYGTGGHSKSTFAQDFRQDTPIPIPLCPSSTLVRFRAIS